MLKDIKGFEGLYFIDEEGRVFNSKWSKEVKHRHLVNGYLSLNLRKDGKLWHKLVHRLVAEAFIPNPENKPQVNHKDGNKQNNSVENLEWVTSAENNDHAFRIGLRKKYQRPVDMLDLNGNYLRTFNSIKEAAQFVGRVGESNSISAHLAGKTRTAYGFRWRDAQRREA